MVLKIHVERNPRTGNQMTIVSNIKHNPQVIDNLATKLKRSCGAGGHVEGKSITIQGSHTDKVKKILQKEGFDVNVK